MGYRVMTAGLGKRFQGNGKITCILSAMVLLTSACGSNDSFPDPGPPKRPQEIGKAQVWVTTGDQSKLLEKQPDIPITELQDSAVPAITVDVSTRLQKIEGFGAALTGSSAYLINQRMSSDQRSALLRDLFDPVSGIGISYLRMTMGASDFSLSDYTYDDMAAGETDYALAHFTIDQDRTNVIPVFKQILAIAPALKIMGSPWSAPAWMKSNGSLRGGKLKEEAYDVYARYFVEYIRHYQAEGIAIDAITPQNEPLHFTANYPCMEMQAPDQLNFIRDHLGPAFASDGISSKIIIYDHNWDNTRYAISILADDEASQYVAGSAFHAYAGNVSAMSTVHDADPGKGLYFTEISGGEWATSFSDNLQWNMAHIFIGTTKNWSKTALLWNLALDENHGPKNNGCQDCRGVVTINSNSGEVTRNVEYYSIAHFSKFVRPGAVRLASTSFDSGSNMDGVVFMNADGTYALVVANANSASRTFVMKSGESQLMYSLPPRSVATILWK